MTHSKLHTQVSHYFIHTLFFGASLTPEIQNHKTRCSGMLLQLMKLLPSQINFPRYPIQGFGNQEQMSILPSN